MAYKFATLTNRLLSLLDMDAGWDNEYPSVAIVPAVAIKAKDIVAKIGTEDSDIFLFPTIKGGLIFEWCHEGKICSLELQPDGSEDFRVDAKSVLGMQWDLLMKGRDHA